MKLKRQANPKAEVAMTPLIDCVFLLLVFFMVSANFKAQEADISFSLPGTAAQSDAVDIPDEQIIQITENGNVFLNDLEYDSVTDPDMPELVKTLILFRQTAEANRVPAMITIAPEDKVKQQRVVDVLNACTAAKISNVTFAVGDEEDI
ncbi:MAG: biopolymer transporter ExbD [Verrucomicrobiota bacterium]|jgi:biopolymer transport protein ExbD|nr:biopolymer transporter ExbD [Verrucomicrobiota bacterium]